MNTTVYYILSIIASITLMVGVYMLLSYLYKLPTTKTEKTIDSVSTLDNPNNQSFINKFVGRISKILLPIVSLNDTTKYKTNNALKYLNYNISAEQHFVDSIAFGIIVTILAALLGIVHPLFLLFALVIGVLIFKMEFEKPVKQFETIRENIEIETAQLAKFISDSLKDGNRNVIDILISCKDSVSSDFKKELEHTITDMKTGNQEKALMDMSTRMTSSNITQIVTGLLGVLRGNDQSKYFESLAEKFHKDELTYIRKKNSTKPGKISKISIILIVAVVAQIIVGVVLSLMDQLSNSGMF